MMKIGFSDVLSFLSLFVSIVAIFFAKKASNQSNKIAEENLKLQHGMVEMEISRFIEDAKSKINEISVVMTPFCAKEKSGNISKEESLILDSYRKNIDAATQTLINCYDSACSRYIDGKLDKVRFKKTYKIEIIQLVKEKDLEKYFHPLTSSYKPILEVYSEWENL